MIGKTISHYRILEKLGAGGMGVVYKAQDTKLDRFVALKFLPPHLSQAEEEKKRFIHEAKAASALDHPNICTIYEIDETKPAPREPGDGRMFIAMACYDGESLQEKIKRGPLPLHEAFDIAIQVAQGLAKAHSKKIVHRDIKPANILITEDETIKIVDFGLAKLGGQSMLTKEGTTLGTMAYMSPEQLQGKQIDARSDIFSFGVVLYEMLTGQLPFSGDYDAALMYSIMNEEPEPVQTHLPDAPSALLHILDRTLEKEAEDRYQTMSDILVELRRLQKRSAGAKQFTEMSEAPAGVKKTPAVEAGMRKSTATKTAIWTILGLFALAATVLGVFQFFGKKEPTAPFQQIQMTRLTTHGKAKQAAISPDGNYVVHVMEDANGRSLWLRHLATNSDTQILPPVEDQLRGLTFSPDGSYIYYVSQAIGSDAGWLPGELYYVPVLGGTARKVLDDVSSGITFSPDGKRFAFLRISITEGKSAVMLANADGTSEEELVTRKFPDLFSPISLPAWSPDGRVIACGEFKRNISRLRLLEITVEDGKERDLTAQKWLGVGPLAWLASGSGLFMIAREQTATYNSQIWYISYPAGEPRRITNETVEKACYIVVSVASFRKKGYTPLFWTVSSWF